jgi:hypothetical protein
LSYARIKTASVTESATPAEFPGAGQPSQRPR